MRKLIDIPDDQVEFLKIEAVKKGTSFKAYLEYIVNQHANEDLFYAELHNESQLGRGVNSYLILLYERIKDVEFNFYEFENKDNFNESPRKFKNMFEFLNAIIHGAEMTIQFNCEGEEADEYFKWRGYEDSSDLISKK